MAKRAERREQSRQCSEVEILNYLCSCIALCSSASLFLYCMLFSLSLSVLLFANFFDCFSSFGTSLRFVFTFLISVLPSSFVYPGAIYTAEH